MGRWRRSKRRPAHVIYMEKYMEKVLIFGAGGFVGSYLSREFLEHGYAVVEIGRAHV